MVNVFKLYAFVIVGFLYFLIQIIQNFRGIHRDTFFFVSDSDRVCTVDIHGFKECKVFSDNV